MMKCIEPTRRPQWRTFSLRALLLLMLLCCLVFGLYAIAAREARRQRALVAQFEQYDPDRLVNPNMLPSVIFDDSESTLPAVIDIFLVRRVVELDLRNTDIEDLTPLTEFPRLKILLLFSVPATDFSPIAQLALLERLNLQRTEIDDLAPVAKCGELRRLDISYTNVVDLSPLIACPHLEKLDLRGSKVNDLSPLRQLKGLRWLDTSGISVSDEHLNELQQALPDCEIRDLDYRA